MCERIGHRVRHTCRAILIAGVVSMLAGCSNNSGPEVSLIAHLSMSVVEEDSFVPLDVRFILDPTSTESTLGPVDSLEVRWDLDGDGNWDCEFGRMSVIRTYSLPNLPYVTWTAGCEVRDKWGNYSRAEKTIALPSYLPVGPDLVAGELTATDDFWSTQDLDTLHVNVPFYVQLPARMWSSSSLTQCQVNCYIDGVLRSSKDRWVPGPFLGHGLIDPQGPFIMAEPGSHELRIELVLPEAIAVEEVDTSNNQKAKSVVFVDADI
jgi:hypothetical protein